MYRIKGTHRPVTIGRDCSRHIKCIARSSCVCACIVVGRPYSLLSQRAVSSSSFRYTTSALVFLRGVQTEKLRCSRDVTSYDSLVNILLSLKEWILFLNVIKTLSLSVFLRLYFVKIHISMIKKDNM